MGRQNRRKASLPLFPFPSSAARFHFPSAQPPYDKKRRRKKQRQNQLLGWSVIHFFLNSLMSLLVIIPGIWILAIMDKIPLFMKRSRFVEEDSSIPCIFLLSRESIRKYRTVYLSIDCLVMILLVLIYSRIVYTLWFKQSDNAVLTNQQQVRPFAWCKSSRI